MTSAVEQQPSGRVTIRKRPDSWCTQFETQLDSAGVPIALPHRASWAECFGTSESLFVGVTDVTGRPNYGCGVDVVPLRSLPGHTVYRVQRFGYGLAADAAEVVLRELVAHAKARRNVLRVVLESFAGEPDGLRSTRRAVEVLGAVPRVPPQRYTRTLRLDLGSTIDAVHEALPKTARRNLRLALKSGLRAEVIADPLHAPALAALEREAFTRTGSQPTETDWPSLIRYSVAHPKLVRVVGLFVSSEGGGVPDLLGFATARAHGDHVEYASAGTTRRPGIKVSLGYPLMWNLLEWAHGLGVRWFDFGGITHGSAGSQDDALGGISDFKRHFGGVEIEVGGEWDLRVGLVRSAVADAISRVVGALRRLG